MTRFVQLLVALAPIVASSGIPAQTPSPDGRSFVVRSDHEGTPDLYVVGEDGTVLRRLTNGPETEDAPEWTADGRHVTFSVFARDSAAIFRVPKDGGAPVRLSVVEGRRPVLSSDGTRVLLTRRIAPDSTELVVASIVGSRATAPRRVAVMRGAIYAATWSPDERGIAFTRLVPGGSIDVWIVNEDGTGLRLLSSSFDARLRPQMPAWSPDGRRIAVQVGADRSASSVPTSHIWVVDVASGEATPLAPHAQPYLDELPTWYADGRRLSFQTNRSGRMERWVMDADGTNARRLFRQEW